MDKLGQRCRKDGTSFWVQQIVQQPLSQGAPFRKRCCPGNRVWQDLLLASVEAGEQAAQAKIAQVGRSGELKDGEGDYRLLKEDRDAEHRRQCPDETSRPDTQGGERSRASSGQERIAGNQGRIWSGRHNQQGCDGQIGGKPRIKETYCRSSSFVQARNARDTVTTRSLPSPVLHGLNSSTPKGVQT